MSKFVHVPGTLELFCSLWNQIHCHARVVFTAATSASMHMTGLVKLGLALQSYLQNLGGKFLLCLFWKSYMKLLKQVSVSPSTLYMPNSGTSMLFQTSGSLSNSFSGAAVTYAKGCSQFLAEKQFHNLTGQISRGRRSRVWRSIHFIDACIHSIEYLLYKWNISMFR